MRFLLPLVLGLALASAYNVKTPKFTNLNPGIRIEYDDGHQDITLVAFHFSINAALKGVKAARWNYDVTKRTGGKFVLERRNINLQPGDKVNYWVYAVVGELGYQLTDKSWVVPGTPPTNNGNTGNPGNTNTGNNGNSGNKVGSGKALGSCSGSACKAAQCTSYPCLVFEDNFNTLDTNVWDHEVTAGGGGNWEFQYYHNDRKNSYVRDGKLYIKPTMTADEFGEDFVRSGRLDLWPQGCTNDMWYGCVRSGNPSQNIIVNPVQSARLRSHKSFNFKYGKVEIEAKLPAGDWIWPAIWLLPTANAYGGWPRSGEIDMMEARGNRDFKQNGRSLGVDSMGTTLHWGPAPGLNGYAKTHKTVHAKSGTFGTGFHKYGMEWTDQYMKMFVDDKLIATFDPGNGGFFNYGGFQNVNNIWAGKGKMAPFDEQFHFILNVAVGGTNYFFPDDTTGPYPKPWNNQSPTAMKEFYDAKNKWLPTWNQGQRNGEDAAMVVNYVKVWQLAQ